jgi:hypothetical protein
MYRFHNRDQNFNRRGSVRDDRWGRVGRGGGFGGGRGSNMKGRQPGRLLRKPQWDLGALKPFSKNFYIPHPNVSNRYVTHQLMYIMYC